jgi:hypothetical protein
MRRALVLTTCTLTGIIASATLARAADPPATVETADLTIGSRAYTSEYATRDSDGDGWTDWTERLEGTDPFDPTSHPDALRVDIVDGTVFVQSPAFPDRLVALDDLELPETKESIGPLLDVVSALTGQTTLGKFRDRLDEELAGIFGDRVGSMLADATTHHDRGDLQLGTRTNGALATLISAEIGMEGDCIKVEVRSSDDTGHTRTIIRFEPIPNPFTTTVTNWSTEKHLDEQGNGTIVTTKTVNLVVQSVTTSTYVNGKIVKLETTDASGTPLEPPIEATPTQPHHMTPATHTNPPTTEAAESDHGPVTTAAPKEPAPETTVAGGYSDPDADPILTPTDQEIEARIEFLIGVKARYGEVLQIPSEPDRDKPGVLDPAEPPCKDDRCVVFVELAIPDVEHVRGACPTTFCNSDPRIDPSTP